MQQQYQEISALKDEKESVEASLRNRIMEIKEELIAQKHEDTEGLPRQLKADLSEVQHRLELMREDWEASNKEKDRALLSMEVYIIMITMKND